MMFDALDSIISAPLAFIYMCILSSEWRFSKKTMRILLPLFIVSLFLIDCGFMMQWGVTQQSKALVSFFNIVACGIFYFCLYKYQDGRLMFIFFSACLFIFISDTISGSFFYTTASVHFLIKISVFLIIATLLHLFFKKPFLEVFREIKYKWWWIMTVPFSLCVVFAMTIIIPRPLNSYPALRPQAIFMCISVFCIYSAFYMMFKELKDRYHIEESIHILQTQISYLLNHADTIHSMDEQAKMYRHDMRHYIVLMNSCIENRDWDSVKQVLDSMSSSLEDSAVRGQLKIYTREPIVDAVLSFFAEKTRKDGIHFNVRLEAPPKESVDITEFSVMLSNAIENAWNACRRMDKQERRCIDITGRYQQSQYFLEISNTYSGQVKFDHSGYPTTDRAGHGYGTQSIRYFVRRCHGYLMYSASDGRFRLRLIL